MSEAKKGNKYGVGNKGKIRSEEVKRKRSEMYRGKNGTFYGKKHSEESKKKMSLTHKGKKLSKEHKIKIGQAGKGKKNPMFGKENKWGHHTKEAKEKIGKTHKGKIVSKETREKLSKSKLGKYIGEKNHQWLGGKSFEPYSVDWTETLKRSIRERDHYICQLCSEYGNLVHHIDYNKKNCKIKNLITLCKSCHSKTNINRESWILFFKSLLKENV